MPYGIGILEESLERNVSEPAYAEVLAERERVREEQLQILKDYDAWSDPVRCRRAKADCGGAVHRTIRRSGGMAQGRGIKRTDPACGGIGFCVLYWC